MMKTSRILKNQAFFSKKNLNCSINMLILVIVQILSVSRFISSSSPFPGVSKEMSSFCSGRPSLPIEVASMIVHVKKNSSFNYKLYLFSGEHVFQTGQVIPRDDFRIHSFPVRLKKLHQFWTSKVVTMTYLNASADSLSMIESQRFQLDDFLAPVSLINAASPHDFPAEASILPGEEEDEPDSQSRLSNASSSIEDLNSVIEFDRDDQVSVARLPNYLRSATGNKSSVARIKLKPQETIVPVGSFSSFHVNLTYLVRKDFDQVEPELIRIQVDAGEFLVNELVLINDGKRSLGSYPRHPDYEFLAHALLRDPNTRITSINQIYEDWITRNLYTIVYIQRRLSGIEDTSRGLNNIVSDRLIFRGSSRALLSADQLDYHVTAAAFITEKNGLHYYLEFLTTGKFYLCAIDWTKRPFKIIDSRRLPIKATRTQLDTEELLLCPPAPCYSSQPLDEIVSYGRLNLIGQKVGKSEVETRLHLRDWNWPLMRLDRNTSSSSSSLSLSNSNERQSIFDWQYQLARRNDIKVKPDTYGYALTGHEIDASYRVHNELYLVSRSTLFTTIILFLGEKANHLITINYTLDNETVTSTHQISLEFPGLSSTLLDPITGAFYDQASNQIYFFKGDRYLGFHYDTKKPLEDFQLPSHSSSSMGDDHHQVEFDQQQPLVSSLPVVGILGRQHQVDGVYHDLETDLIYIFTGMKFYTFQAKEFKNGSFKPKAQSLPLMLCTNELFLKGCTFDRVYENPCKPDKPPAAPSQKLKARLTEVLENSVADGAVESTEELKKPTSDESSQKEAEEGESAFKEEQQKRLRLIATRPTSLLGFSLLSSSTADAATLFKPLIDATSSQAFDRSDVVSNQRIVVYLLMALVSIVVLASIILLVLLITCAAQHRRSIDSSLRAGQEPSSSLERQLYMRGQNEQFNLQYRYRHHHQHLPLVNALNCNQQQPSFLPNTQQHSTESPTRNPLQFSSIKSQRKSDRTIESSAM